MKENPNRVVILVLLAWLCFAVGLAGWFQNASALAVAATVWTLTALVLLGCWKVRTIRACMFNIDLRWLVLLHLTRLFAGAYFLVLCQSGQLPCAFATPAGWGDMGIGVLAVAVVSAMRPTQFAKTFLLSWNTLGLIDNVFVVASALRFNFFDVTMNPAGTPVWAPLRAEPIPCAECGSRSRVGRGLCLNCLLHRGFGADTSNNETLEDVLAEIDVRDPDRRIGNYQMLDQIGHGGMGVIYRARQRHSRRIVALKRILGYEDSRETLIRFRREALAAASLDHPNILPIYVVGEDEDGLPFFSMKFAAGGSLRDAAPYLRSEPFRSVELMAKVARAVQYAHAQGILHRDLKPGNILLDGRD